MSGGLGKTFNSHSVTGRANVGKATYAALAVGYLLYRITRRSTPPAAPRDEDFLVVKEPECGCGCGRKLGADEEGSPSASMTADTSNLDGHVFGNAGGHKPTQTHDASFVPSNAYDASGPKPDDIDVAYITYKTIQILLNNQLQPNEVVHLQKQQELAKRAFERSQKAHGSLVGGLSTPENLNVVKEMKSPARKGLLDLIRDHFTQESSAADNDIDAAEVSATADTHDASGIEDDISDVELYFRFMH